MTDRHATVVLGDREFQVANADVSITSDVDIGLDGSTVKRETYSVAIDGDVIETTDSDAPSDLEWAGSTIEIGDEELWVFVRDGRVHLHDAETGDLKHIEPVEAIPAHELEALAEEWEFGPALNAGQQGSTQVSEAIHERARELREYIDAHRDEVVEPDDE